MKKVFIAAIIILAAGLGGISFLFRDTAPPTPDMLSLNEAVINAAEIGDKAETLRLLRDALEQEASRIDAARKSRDSAARGFLYAYIVVMAITCGCVYLYLYRTILRPFKKLETFAARVASGDLDIALEMDRKNRFGAFTESFDLMREQLAAARENERLASISKKELVASLSHDVKTPISSIKVMAELFQAKHGETPEMAAITAKADQVDLLISNLFTATLEELQQLKVYPSEISSIELAQCIRDSDYQKKVIPFTLPECVVMADSLRFRQVIDNIIGNSYKYAGTDIEVSGGFEKERFVLILRDSGPGVSADELSLLCEKFYRAGNAEGKSGSGLGLYLSRYFIGEMGGALEVENQSGLTVKILLKI